MTERRKKGNGAVGFRALLGVRLKELREARGLTQEALAEATRGRVAVNVLSAYERGSHDPKFSRLLALTVALGVRPSDLLPEPLRGILGGAQYDPAEALVLLDEGGSDE